MKTYVIQVKKPFIAAVLRDRLSGDIWPSKESDNHRTKRENIGNMLENLTSKKPTWVRRAYCYHAELTEEQAEEVRSWAMVRTVTKKK